MRKSTITKTGRGREKNRPNTSSYKNGHTTGNREILKKVMPGEATGLSSTTRRTLRTMKGVTGREKEIEKKITEGKKIRQS